jgi:uncharacterized membrane protein YadS
MEILKKRLPGILLAAALAVPAWWIGTLLPVVGSPVTGILIGIVLAAWRRPEALNPRHRLHLKKAAAIRHHPAGL